MVTRNSPTGLEGPKGWGFRKRMMYMGANLRYLRVVYHHAALAHGIGTAALNMGAGSVSPFLRWARCPPAPTPWRDLPRALHWCQGRQHGACRLLLHAPTGQSHTTLHRPLPCSEQWTRVPPMAHAGFCSTCTTPRSLSNERASWLALRARCMPCGGKHRWMACPGNTGGWRVRAPGGGRV